MRVTTHLRICLERRLLCERSCVGVHRNLCVAFFSIDPPFLIPPDVYHDGYYLDPFFGALSFFINLVYFFHVFAWITGI